MSERVYMSDGYWERIGDRWKWVHYPWGHEWKAVKAGDAP